MQPIKTAFGSLAIAALLASSPTPAAWAAVKGGDDKAAVAEANRVMGEALARQEQERLQHLQAAEEAALSPKARKAVEKKRKKEAATRAKADAAAKPGAAKKNSKVGNAVGGCVAGAAVGALTGLLFGGGKSAVRGALIGCGAGAILGLSKKDEADLNEYVDNDYAMRDDLESSTFNAPESGKVVTLSKAATTYQDEQHQLLVPAEIEFNQSDIKVNQRYMRSTAVLNMRSGPNATSTVNGKFAIDDKVLTYGTTLDGQWTYVIERSAEGDTLLGYAASKMLSSNLNVSSNVRVVTAKPTKADSPVAQGGRKKQTSKPATAASANLVPASAAKPRATTFTASTACKATTLSTGGSSTSKSSCRGGAGLAFNFHGTEGIKGA